MLQFPSTISLLRALCGNFVFLFVVIFSSLCGCFASSLSHCESLCVSFQWFCISMFLWGYFNSLYSNFCVFVVILSPYVVTALQLLLGSFALFLVVVSVIVTVIAAVLHIFVTFSISFWSCLVSL